MDLVEYDFKGFKNFISISFNKGIFRKDNWNYFFIKSFHSLIILR